MIRLTTVFAQVKDKLRSRPTRLSNIFEGSTAFVRAVAWTNRSTKYFD